MAYSSAHWFSYTPIQTKKSIAALALSTKRSMARPLVHSKYISSSVLDVIGVVLQKLIEKYVKFL